MPPTLIMIPSCVNERCWSATHLRPTRQPRVPGGRLNAAAVKRDGWGPEGLAGTWVGSPPIGPLDRHSCTTRLARQEMRRLVITYVALPSLIALRRVWGGMPK